jgi:cobalt-zinc-cadmium resistance protein CzcA
MSNTVVSALVGALVFSVTLIPVLATLVYRRQVTHRESPVLKLADRVYAPVLGFAVRRPLAVLLVACAAMAASLWGFSQLGSEFLPELNEGGLYLTFTLPPNISISEGRKLVPRITKLIRGLPQVKEVLSQLGRPEDGTDAKLSNNLEFFVQLNPPETWPKETPSQENVLSRMQEAVGEIPGLEVNFSQPIGDNVNESISGQQGQVAVKLYGEDLIELQAHAEAVKRTLARVPGAADVALYKSGVVPQIQVEPDRAALARYGMNLGEFQHVFQTALGGRPLAAFWEGERRFDVVMRLPLSSRDDVEKIRKLLVPIEGGAMVPIEAMAHVSTGFGRATINRENGRRYVGVRLNVRGRDLGSFVDEARARVDKEAPLAPGMGIEWGGEFESKERAMHRLLTVVPVALLLTLLFLFKAFDSFSLALLTLLNVPFALMGGVWGLFAAHMPLSVAAAVGFIALIGQASLNGVLVVSAIAERHRAGAALEEAIVAGARERLRPVLMTALLAALGLVPAALSHAIGSETQQPIAVVIVTGTLSACLLTLVMLPAMYRLWAALAARLSPVASQSPVADA